MRLPSPVGWKHPVSHSPEPIQVCIASRGESQLFRPQQSLEKTNSFAAWAAARDRQPDSKCPWTTRLRKTNRRNGDPAKAKSDSTCRDLSSCPDFKRKAARILAKFGHECFAFAIQTCRSGAPDIPPSCRINREPCDPRRAEIDRRAAGQLALKPPLNTRRVAVC